MTIFTDKVLKYNERLKKDFQINDIQACGIWGNLGTETGGFTMLQELKPVVKGSRGGFGWMQWTGPRRKKFEAWCAVRNLDPKADETNYQYLVHETLTDEWKSIQQVRKTSSIKAATETFMLLNLRPGIQHLDNRLEWAQKAADALNKQKDTNIAKTAGKASAPLLIGSGLIAYYWDQVNTYVDNHPWIIPVVALPAIALLVSYLFNKLRS